LRFEKVVAEHPDFDFQRNAIYLRFSHRDYTKGTALRELARELGVERERILAVGDNHNDLSMLDGAHAAMVACPANAVPEVRQAVEAAAGWVSEHPDALGTADGIVYFLARSPSRS
jgi:hydroxymethylpyrimidine pyrophosphatase-like HAD family hydrolase